MLVISIEFSIFVIQSRSIAEKSPPIRTDAETQTEAFCFQ